MIKAARAYYFNSFREVMIMTNCLLVVFSADKVQLHDCPI